MKKLWKKLRLWYRPMSKRYERLLNKLIEHNNEELELYLCIIADIYLKDDLLLEDLEFRFKFMDVMYPDHYEKTAIYLFSSKTAIYLFSSDPWDKGKAIWLSKDFSNRFNFLMAVIKDLS